LEKPQKIGEKRAVSGYNTLKTHKVMVIFQKYFVFRLTLVDYAILPNFSPNGAFLRI
jgi:hypothetical protein